jgi:transcription initiation factor IIE alpha subunit
MSKNLSAKQKMLATLKKSEGYNTFTTKQAQQRFGITNVSARIEELRKEGHVIYTNKRTLEDGRKITYYRMGTPTKGLVKSALRAGYSFTA